MDADRDFLNATTQRVIGCAFAVANGLGAGFLEKVYENALVHELRKNNLRVETQKGIHVYYDGIAVGEFVADVLVEDRILVELKAVSVLNDVHFAQCMNYLKATGLRVCLLLNFGSTRLEVKRVVNRF